MYHLTIILLLHRRKQDDHPAVFWHQFPLFADTVCKDANRRKIMRPVKDHSWTHFLHTSFPDNAGKDLIVQATAGTLTGKATVKVLKVKWPEQQISVKKTFVNPPKEAMKRIDAERKKSSEAINRVTPERYWRGEFQRPVPGVVTSAFGGRRMFNGELRSYHRGVDLRGAEGTPIKAVADGKVAIAQNMYFAGNTVYLDHGQGVVSSYAHMSRLDVKPGEMVKAGQQIGLVGATGRVTGPHLHLGVNILGVAVDPLSLVPKQ